MLYFRFKASSLHSYDIEYYFTTPSVGKFDAVSLFEHKSKYRSDITTATGLHFELNM